MIKVTETDPVAEVRAMFELIIMISTQNGVIDPKIIDTTIYGLEQFSKTFKD